MRICLGVWRSRFIYLSIVFFHTLFHVCISHNVGVVVFAVFFFIRYSFRHLPCDNQILIVLKTIFLRILMSMFGFSMRLEELLLYSIFTNVTCT